MRASGEPMHEIEDLFEEQDVLGRLPQFSPDHDAGEALGPQDRFDSGFGRLSRSDQARVTLEPDLAQPRDLRLDGGSDKLP